MTEREDLVFCISATSNGYFPHEFANDRAWQNSTGFKPQQKPQSIFNDAAPTQSPVDNSIISENERLKKEIEELRNTQPEKAKRGRKKKTPVL